MTKKEKLLKEGVFGVIAMNATMAAGVGFGITDAFWQASSEGQSPEILQQASNFCMYTFLMFGVYTSAAGTMYYNLRDREEAARNRDDFDGPS